jgi:hypothetical protein
MGVAIKIFLFKISSMRNRLVLFCVGIFFLVPVILKSQIANEPSVKVIPGFSFGYTFGKGINAGVQLGFSFFDYKLDNRSGYAGVNISFAVFTHARKLYENGYYRVFAVNLMNVYNEQFLLKLGLAKTKLKWGLNEVNKSYSNGWGINIDAGLKPFLFSPYVGFRYFRINNVCMGIGATNPKFVYVGYGLPFNLTHQVMRIDGGR